MRKNFKDEKIAKMYYTLNLILLQNTLTKCKENSNREKDMKSVDIQKRYLYSSTTMKPETFKNRAI
ncbi:hypothetical protein ACVWU4_000941 [Campylobacter coli]